MDAPEPKSIQEMIDYAHEYKCYSDIRTQVNLAQMIMDDIEHIMWLDTQLAYAMVGNKNYETYSLYMDKMADILREILKVETFFKQVFPTFYDSDLVKVIRCHLRRMR